MYVHGHSSQAAALQREVGCAFPGSATLIPVDVLAEAIWLNANSPHEAMETFMSLRLRRALESSDIGVDGADVTPSEFVAASDRAGFSTTFIKAFVPADIGDLVANMHQTLSAPPAVLALIDACDEEEVIRKNVEASVGTARREERHIPPRSPPRAPRGANRSPRA